MVQILVKLVFFSHDKAVELVCCDSRLSRKHLLPNRSRTQKPKTEQNICFSEQIPPGSRAEVHHRFSEHSLKTGTRTDFMKYSIYSSFWKQGHVFQTNKTNLSDFRVKLQRKKRQIAATRSSAVILSNTQMPRIHIFVIYILKFSDC